MKNLEIRLGVESDLVAAGERQALVALHGSRRARGLSTGSTSSGISPMRPAMTAKSVPWPCAGQGERAVELGAHARTAASTPLASSSRRKLLAAVIGPTVCELEGPMPMRKTSKTL